MSTSRQLFYVEHRLFRIRHSGAKYLFPVNPELNPVCVFWSTKASGVKLWYQIERNVSRSNADMSTSSVSKVKFYYDGQSCGTRGNV